MRCLLSITKQNISQIYFPCTSQLQKHRTQTTQKEKFIFFPINVVHIYILGWERECEMKSEGIQLPNKSLSWKLLWILSNKCSWMDVFYFFENINKRFVVAQLIIQESFVVKEWSEIFLSVEIFCLGKFHKNKKRKKMIGV